MNRKHIRVKFINFWGNFCERNNIIYNVLEKYYDVELSENPQYLFYGNYNANIYKYDCIRIFYTHENFIPDFNLCDYAIAFAYIDFEDRYLRFPLYLNGTFNYYQKDDYAKDMKLALHKHEFTQADLENKQGFCSFVVSSSVDSVRNDFFDKLCSYKMVSSGGRYRNNVGGPVADKEEFQRKYKFCICFENSRSSGYTTEKLMQAFAAQTLPIYYGSPRISEEFNEKAFIDCSKYKSWDEVVSRVKEIDSDDDLYIKIMQEPAFCKGFSLDKKIEQLERFLCHIIDQEYEDAFRRNQSDYGMKYEKKQRIWNPLYNGLLKLDTVIHRAISKFK